MNFQSMSVAPSQVSGGKLSMTISDRLTGNAPPMTPEPNSATTIQNYSCGDGLSSLLEFI